MDTLHLPDAVAGAAAVMDAPPDGHPERNPDTPPDITALSDRARTLYRAQVRLRQKDAHLEATRHSRYGLAIPASMTGRAFPVYSWMGHEKIQKAKDLITDPQGIHVHVAPPGTTDTGAKAAARVENWLRGALVAVEHQAEREIEPSVDEDLLLKSRGYVRVLPMPGAWLARDEEGGLNLDDVSLLPDVMDRANAQVRRQQRAQALDRRTREVFPVHVSWAPARGIIAQPDGRVGGLRVVWDLQEWPAQTVIDQFTDKHGKTLATALQGHLDEGRLTDRDVVTLLVVADRTHITYATLGWQLDVSDELRQDRQATGAIEQVLFHGRHGMGVVPYAAFPGRETASSDPALRYSGLLDPVDSLIRRYDELATQLASTARMIAWPGVVITRHVEAQSTTPGGGEEPAAFELDEGGINESLGPGEDLKAVPWTSPEARQFLSDTAQLIRQQVDLLTFGPAVSGSHAAESGYLQSQLQAASESVLEPFLRGKKLGWQRVCELLLRAARWLCAEGVGPIPVRYASPDGLAYVTMTQDLADIDWDVTCEVRPRPIGGEMALAQTLALQKAQGWLSDFEAMQRLNNRDPERTMQRIFQERLKNNEQISNMVVAAIQQRALALLAQQPSPPMPGQPVLPQALAQTIGGMTDPGAMAAQARLPQGMLGGGVPGGPGAINPAPPPPTPSEQTVGAHQMPGVPAMPGLRPGLPIGQAQASPGGRVRSDIGNAA